MNYARWAVAILALGAVYVAALMLIAGDRLGGL